MLEPGPFTTVQDAPGRVGYWHVGVPPNGPMDELSHHLVNRVVGNVESAATLELTGSGPTLRFPTETVIALGGAAMPLTVGGRAAPRWVPVTVPAGSVVEVGANVGPGLRSYLAVRGGIDTVPYLGSRSTFTLGGFGGHEGRALEAATSSRWAPTSPRSPRRSDPGSRRSSRTTGRSPSSSARTARPTS